MNDETTLIYRLGYFWYNASYEEFCELVYGGKNDSYTQEKWNAFQKETMYYLGSLDPWKMQDFEAAVNTYYERNHQ
jgi:hypothetical protein